jgi:hypothetical protein
MGWCDQFGLCVHGPLLDNRVWQLPVLDTATHPYARCACWDFRDVQETRGFQENGKILSSPFCCVADEGHTFSGPRSGKLTAPGTQRPQSAPEPLELAAPLREDGLDGRAEAGLEEGFMQMIEILAHVLDRPPCRRDSAGRSQNKPENSELGLQRRAPIAPACPASVITRPSAHSTSDYRRESVLCASTYRGADRPISEITSKGAGLSCCGGPASGTKPRQMIERTDGRLMV